MTSPSSGTGSFWAIVGGVDGWNAPLDNVRPRAEAIGWCVQCGTVQRGADARLVEQAWDDGRPSWVCLRCDSEPWGWGVKPACPHPSDSLVQQAIWLAEDWTPDLHCVVCTHG